MGAVWHEHWDQIEAAVWEVGSRRVTRGNSGIERKLKPRLKWITQKEEPMLGTILLVILILLLVGAVPAWPYSRGWGYYPSGGLGLVLIIVLILVLLGRI